ncbi:YejL family protein [Vibrio profundum]|uniref:YejL family protein n=1 Tax=Vibrio profundum TaxID=2910247 RepID=UPI003D0C8EED
MPITSKYTDNQVEQILAEVASVLKKHEASPELSLMIAGNIATNIINQNIAAAQRKEIADKFAQALMSSLEITTH